MLVVIIKRDYPLKGEFETLKNVAVSWYFWQSMGPVDVEIEDISYEFRTVIEGNMFICIKGNNVDGTTL